MASAPEGVTRSAKNPYAACLIHNRLNTIRVRVRNAQRRLARHPLNQEPIGTLKRLRSEAKFLRRLIKEV